MRRVGSRVVALRRVLYGETLVDSSRLAFARQVGECELEKVRVKV